ncbi:MAG: hypothetical protein PHI28_15405 [Mangrovibacterium sp.]|nr:hypothetical protein [Mangrovibacterium sp.]
MKAKKYLYADRSVLKSDDLYAGPSNGTIFSPFGLNIDPMEHLILINFEKDPDELYRIFEVQQARDENDRKRLLIIAYRNDGGADVYYQGGFPFASQDRVLNHASFIERPMEDARFDVNSDHIEVFFSFEDETGRKIKASVNERNRQKKNPFFLLAPVGEVSRNPISLPVYSLYEMSFTRQKYTDIEIEIDNVKHKPDTFPIPIDCSKNYFTRYSLDAFNVDWNKNFKGPLSPLIPGDKHEAEEKGISYEYEKNKGHCEIKRISAKNRKHTIRIDFSPAIPDIVCLREGIGLNGGFSITTDKTKGTIRGFYQLKREGNEIDIEVRPDCGWEPNESRWVLRFLFFVVKVFKEWPKSYVWTSKIKLDDVSQPIMESSWKRV